MLDLFGRSPIRLSQVITKHVTDFIDRLFDIQYFPTIVVAGRLVVGSSTSSFDGDTFHKSNVVVVVVLGLKLFDDFAYDHRLVDTATQGVFDEIGSHQKSQSSIANMIVRMLSPATKLKGEKRRRRRKG